MAAALVCLALTWGSVAMAAKLPPTIDDLDGVVLVVVSKQTQYDLSNGDSGTGMPAVNWTFTKVDSTTLNIHETGSTRPDFKAHYENGTLVTGTVDASSLATQSSFTRMQLSGAPGKISGKGEYMNFDTVGARLLWMGTMTAKQLNS